MKSEHTQNKLIFMIAISDAFRDDEDRELDNVGKIEIPEDGDFTKVMTELFYAVQAFYNMTTESEADPLDFLSILTRLVFQDNANGGDSDDSGKRIGNCDECYSEA